MLRGAHKLDDDFMRSRVRILDRSSLAFNIVEQFAANFGIATQCVAEEFSYESIFHPYFATFSALLDRDRLLKDFL
jgi:hypothetical protein